MTNSALPGASIPKLDLVQKNPDAAAVISKAIRPHLHTGFNLKKRETHHALNQGKVQSISDTQKSRVKENEDILDLFPDILLAKQIIVSSILAPKDMFSQNLIYQGVQKLLPATTQAKIDAVVKEHIEGHYDLRAELPLILGDALFRTGSYVSAVIPEAAVDEIINGQVYATESHKSFINEIIDSNGKSVSLGLLGPSRLTVDPIVSLENFFNGQAPAATIDGAVSFEGLIDPTVKGVYHDSENKKVNPPTKFDEVFVNRNTSGFLEITDNYQLIKLPKLLDVVSNQRIKRALKHPMYSKRDRSVSLESYGNVDRNDTLTDPKKLNRTEFENVVYKNGRRDSEALTVFPTQKMQKRYSIGRPLRVRIPSEAVIPVFPPGDPSNHRGYFVLVDVDGNWVTRSSMDISNQGLQSLMSNQNSNNTMSSLVLNKANKSLTETKPNIIVDNMLEIYSSVVEADMIARLKNGVYGTKLEIGHDKEWDRIMLARALSGKMTRIVYIPSEVITYYAFDYHENGIGKSYLDQVRMISSLRAVLLFSKIMAELKNAINVTKVDMTLDPEDPDPQKTIEMATHDILKLREAYFPLGVNNPVDLMEWIQRAGMMFTFKNHPGLPETSFEFSTANLQHSVPDEKTAEDLRKQTFMTFGLTPEQVDEGFSPQFATTIIQQNALFARRILLLSDATAVHLSNDVRNICINDPIILKDIRMILEETGDELVKHLSAEDQEEYKQNKPLFIQNFLERVVENIWIDLPKPDIGSTNSKADAFKEYKAVLEEVLTSFISSEVFSSSEFATHADEIKNFWLHYLLRKWVTDEAFLPDIAEIFARDDDGKPSVMVKETMEKYMEDVLLSAIGLLEDKTTLTNAADKDLDKLGVPAGQGPLDTGGSSSDDSFGTGDDMPGLDLDMDIPEEPDSDTEKKDSETTEESEETSTTTNADGTTTTTTSSSAKSGGVGSFRNF